MEQPPHDIPEQGVIYPAVTHEQSVATWIEVRPDAPSDLSVHVPDQPSDCDGCPAATELDLIGRMEADQTVLAHGNTVAAVLREQFMPRSSWQPGRVQILNDGTSSPTQQAHVRATELGTQAAKHQELREAVGCEGPERYRRLGRLGTVRQVHCPIDTIMGARAERPRPADDEIEIT